MGYVRVTVRCSNPALPILDVADCTDPEAFCVARGYAVGKPCDDGKHVILSITVSSL